MVLDDLLVVGLSWLLVCLGLFSCGVVGLGICFVLSVCVLLMVCEFGRLWCWGQVYLLLDWCL